MNNLEGIVIEMYNSTISFANFLEKNGGLTNLLDKNAKCFCTYTKNKHYQKFCKKKYLEEDERRGNKNLIQCLNKTLPRYKKSTFFTKELEELLRSSCNIIQQKL